MAYSNWNYALTSTTSATAIATARSYYLLILLSATLGGLVLQVPGVAEGTPQQTFRYPCPHSPDAQLPAGPSAMPQLPAQFSVHVEANIVQKVTSLFNYATGERFDILPDGACKTLDLNDSSFDVFGFTELRASGKPSLLQAASVFRFTDEFPKVFLGETTVRGIPAYHWQSCQTWKTPEGQTRAAYVLDYFFSRPDHSTATDTVLVPLRALLNGTALNVDGEGKALPSGGTHNFSHVYEFSFFRPGPPPDEDELFEIPRGSVCQRKVSKALPQLPDQFSLAMEVQAAGSPRNRPPMTERMVFDYDFGLIQTERYAPRGTGERFGLTRLTVVEDYHNHVQYVVDTYDGNCSVSRLPQGLGTSSDSNDSGGNEISMRHGQQLLQYGKRDFKYQGQRRLRGMKVDVWADSTASGMVQEVYFLADWPSARLRSKLSRMNVDLDLSRMNILVGTYLLNTTALSASLSPLFKLFGDRAIKQWGDRWQSDYHGGGGGGGGGGGSGGSPPFSPQSAHPPHPPHPPHHPPHHPPPHHLPPPPTSPSRSSSPSTAGGPRGAASSSSSLLPPPGDLLRMRMPRRRGFGWNSARMRFPDASEKMIHIFNYLPLHMDTAAFDVSSCYENNKARSGGGGGGEMFVYLTLEGSYSSVVSHQRYLFLSAVKSAVAKAGAVSILRVVKVNVWQDIASSNLNLFFSLLEPPTGPGLPAQPSCSRAFQKLSAAVAAGMTVTVKHPLRQTTLSVVKGSLKYWQNVEELWEKMAQAKAGGAAGGGGGGDQQGSEGTYSSSSAAAAAGMRGGNSNSGGGGGGGGGGGESGYSGGQFAGMAFAMLLVGAVVGVAGLYVALRRLRPDIHLLPYQRST